MLVFSILAAGFLVTITYSSFFEKWLSAKLSSYNLLGYLNEVGILTFFFSIYRFVFFASSQNVFYLITAVTHLLTLFYVIFSRYYIFVILALAYVLPTGTKIAILTAIFICLMALLSRLLINLSSVVSVTIMDVRKEFWNGFLLTEPYTPDTKPSTSSNVPESQSVIHTHKHTHTHASRWSSTISYIENGWVWYRYLHFGGWLFGCLLYLWLVYSSSETNYGSSKTDF